MRVSHEARQGARVWMTAVAVTATLVTGCRSRKDVATISPDPSAQAAMAAEASRN